MTKLTEVEGIGARFAQKLMDAGIATTRELLEEGASPQGRAEIAEKTGISPDRILRWINHVDLFRITGVGQEYAELLEAAGVDTVPELAQRNPTNLHQKMVEVNQEKKLVRQVASQGQVVEWVKQAQELPRKITY
jgi:predicted flap endonuclease-1-like 5' DNA nuclease